MPLMFIFNNLCKDNTVYNWVLLIFSVPFLHHLFHAMCHYINIDYLYTLTNLVS